MESLRNQKIPPTSERGAKNTTRVLHSARQGPRGGQRRDQGRKIRMDERLGLNRGSTIGEIAWHRNVHLANLPIAISARGLNTRSRAGGYMKRTKGKELMGKG